MISSEKILVPDDMPIILWGDVETTGLSPFLSDDNLLQVAFFVTDPNLNLLDENGYEAFVKHENVDELYKNSGEYIQDMHTKTGLWDVLKTGETKSLSTIDQELHDYVLKFKNNRSQVWWGGNSIKLDRDFTEFYLPNFYTTIGHRSVDVSSVAFLARNWYEFEFAKKSTHNAKDDILESIAELKAYRENIFR